MVLLLRLRPSSDPECQSVLAQVVQEIRSDYTCSSSSPASNTTPALRQNMGCTPRGLASGPLDNIRRSRKVLFDGGVGILVPSVPCPRGFEDTEFRYAEAVAYPVDMSWYRGKCVFPPLKARVTIVSFLTTAISHATDHCRYR